MTIIAAVRTGSAVVFAADSKVTTQGVGGVGPDRSPIIVPQSYDHVTKVVHDTTETAIAAFAGNGSIGRQGAADYFARLTADLHQAPDVQDKVVNTISENMARTRREFFEEVKIPLEAALSTTCILAAPAVNGTAPRVWQIALAQGDAKVREILQGGGVWLEGSAELALTLLYARSDSFLESLTTALGIPAEQVGDALKTSSFVLPVHRMNFWAMPLQDAIDFAVFCAQTQVTMERFLPGMPRCGGPIDVMTLEMAPRVRVRAFPGKSLHHPEQRGRT